MRIPSKLKIGGHTIQVRMMVNDGGKYGQYIPESGLIYISSDAPQTQQEATLIHEIFHVINGTLGHGDMGHALLESLSAQWYQVLADNKLLRK